MAELGTSNAQQSGALHIFRQTPALLRIDTVHDDSRPASTRLFLAGDGVGRRRSAVQKLFQARAGPPNGGDLFVRHAPMGHVQVGEQRVRIIGNTQVRRLLRTSLAAKAELQPLEFGQCDEEEGQFGQRVVLAGEHAGGAQLFQLWQVARPRLDRVEAVAAGNVEASQRLVAIAEAVPDVFAGHRRAAAEVEVREADELGRGVDVIIVEPPAEKRAESFARGQLCRGGN